MTNISTEAPRRGLRSSVEGVLASIGRGIVAYTEMLARTDELKRLSALSDDELSRKGIRRDEIVQYVFRDKIHF